MAKGTRKVSLEQFLGDVQGCLDLVARQGERIVVEVDGQSIGIERTAPNVMWTAEDIANHEGSYDPEKFRAMLAETAGAFKGLDREAFLAEMREARGQDSIGRPAD